MPPLESESLDQTVDWDAADPMKAAAALQQAEGDVPADDAAFTPRQVRYQGRLFTAQTAEDWDAVNKIIGDHRRSSESRYVAEMGQLREQLAELKGKLSAQETLQPEPLPEIEFPSIELARADPERWRADIIAWKAASDLKRDFQVEERIRTELERKDAKAAEESRGRAWSDEFYTRHAHLNNDMRRVLVQAVYLKHEKELAAFGDDREGAQARLAALSEAAIAEATGAPIDRTSRDTTRPPRLEGPSRAGPRPVDVTRTAFTGASWLAKERARMRGQSEKA
jgi:hypothetical protein